MPFFIRKNLPWIFVLAIAGYLTWVLLTFHKNPAFADFLLKCGIALGTFSAIYFALFGDYLRDTFDPIRLTIELPEESNTVIDKMEIDGKILKTYVHHLIVKNLTPYKPVKNCQVWLKKIYVQQVNGGWKEDGVFAVPRLMVWAPSEMKWKERTFAKQQVLDLGITMGNNQGFLLGFYQEQGGNVPSHFPAGASLRLALYATSENYHEERVFMFEVQIPKAAMNEDLEISKVIKI